MLKSDLEQEFRRTTEYRKVKVQGLSAHAWGRCAVRFFVWVLSASQGCGCLPRPYIVMFGHTLYLSTCWQARFEMYFDSTTNIQYMHLPIDFCRTLVIFSPERLESYVNW